jgi:hypothetical protein
MAGAIFLGILPVWASLRQRALDKSIAEINKKMDLNIALDSLERSRHRWVSNDADFRDYAPSGNERRLSVSGDFAPERSVEAHPPGAPPVLLSQPPKKRKVAEPVAA